MRFISDMRSAEVQWQVEGKSAAGARLARHHDLASKQLGDLSADGKSEAGASVLAVRRSVCLLECLEDEIQLRLVDTDSGVDDLEGHEFAGMKLGSVIQHDVDLR